MTNYKSSWMVNWEGIEPQDHVGTKDLGKTVDSIVCETFIERAPASG